VSLQLFVVNLPQQFMLHGALEVSVKRAIISLLLGQIPYKILQNRYQIEVLEYEHTENKTNHTTRFPTTYDDDDCKMSLITAASC